MSEKTRQNILSWGALSALCACVMCLMAITRSAWTVASSWGTAMQKMESIDSGLKEHIKQTQEFRTEFERRLRAIENKVGIGYLAPSTTVRLAE